MTHCMAYTHLIGQLFRTYETINNIPPHHYSCARHGVMRPCGTGKICQQRSMHSCLQVLSGRASGIKFRRSTAAAAVFGNSNSADDEYKANEDITRISRLANGVQTTAQPVVKQPANLVKLCRPQLPLLLSSGN